jgi:NitT/TauT family transport system substrate-binding protein
MTAYMRGVRDYNDAFFKGVNRTQTVETLAGVLSIEPQLFEVMAYPHVDPNATLNMASLRDLMNWYVQMGYLSAAVDLDTLVDSSFTEAAISKLGWYQ